MNKKRPDMLNDPVGSVLLRMTVPMLVGLFAVMTIGLVDAFFIGQLGVAQLAAIGFSGPIAFVVLSISFGIGVGVSAVFSRIIGSGDMHTVRCMATDALILVTLLSGTICFVGWLTIDITFSALGAKDEVLKYINQYMTIWYGGASFLAIAIVGNNICRANGDSRSPGVQMLVVTVINIVLTPILVFGIGPIPAFGVAGAAWATFIAFAGSLVMALHTLTSKSLFALGSPNISRLVKSSASILYIGLPSTVTFMIVPLGLAVITWLIAPIGKDAVAAFGVGGRIEPIALLGITAISTILTPFIGQNIGARNYKRVAEGVLWGAKFCVIWGACSALILVGLAIPLGGVFSDSATVRDYIVLYLYILPASYIFLGFATISNSICSALRMPMTATAIKFVETFVLGLPLAWLGKEMYGIIGVFAGLAFSHFITGAVVIVWIIWSAVPRICDDHAKNTAEQLAS